MHQDGKKQRHHNAFNKYENSIRKAWATLKEIMYKKAFNWPLTEIGSKLTKLVNAANKAQFNSYLTTPLLASFNFAFTKTRKTLKKIIWNWRPKSSAGCDNILTKLLKENVNVVSLPLSSIINQSLCTRIFVEKLKITKVIPFYKKDDNKAFGNYCPISLLSSKFFRLPLTNFMIISHLMAYSSKASIDSTIFTRLN